MYSSSRLGYRPLAPARGAVGTTPGGPGCGGGAMAPWWGCCWETWAYTKASVNRNSINLYLQLLDTLNVLTFAILPTVISSSEG